MQVSKIISEIDREIERLQEARNLLADGNRRTGRRKLSAEGRKKISEALKARWAERKRAAAKSSK